MGLFDYDYEKLRHMSIPEQEAYKRRVKIQKLQLEELEHRKRERSRETDWEEGNYGSNDGFEWLLWPIWGFTIFFACNIGVLFLWCASTLVTKHGYDGFEKFFDIECNVIATVIRWIVRLAHYK